MKSKDGLKVVADFQCAFVAYQPHLIPLGSSKGGGYKLEILLSDSEWEEVKELNNPRLQAMIFTVAIVGQKVK
jgi:hypothetical protein